VRDRNGIVQVVTSLSVPAGAAHTASVSWAPPAGPTPPTALAVRALIVAPGDLNVDDKRAMTLLSDVAERVLRMAADDGEARGDLDLRVTRAVVEDQPPERLVVSLHHTGWEVSPSDLARANTRAPTPEEERTGRMWDVLRFRPRAAGGTPAASTTRAPEFVALRTRQTTLPQSLRGAPPRHDRAQSAERCAGGDPDGRPAPRAGHLTRGTRMVTKVTSQVPGIIGTGHHDIPPPRSHAPS
jgi:hypothetical protein